MTSQNALSTLANTLIDAADALLSPTSGDDAWLKSVALVDRMGCNGLNVAEIEHATGAPVWFRSSMKTDWLTDYFAQDFVTFDPLILSALKGNRLSRMVNGKVDGVEEKSARVDQYCDQITGWGYQTLDYHIFASDNPNTFKGLCFSTDFDRPLASAQEKLLCADSVGKQRVAGAESRGLNGARAPFLSGFARLLRCRKDLG